MIIVFLVPEIKYSKTTLKRIFVYTNYQIIEY